MIHTKCYICSCLLTKITKSKTKTYDNHVHEICLILANDRFFLQNWHKVAI